MVGADPDGVDPEAGPMVTFCCAIQRCVSPTMTPKEMSLTTPSRLDSMFMTVMGTWNLIRFSALLTSRVPSRLSSSLCVIVAFDVLSLVGD